MVRFAPFHDFGAARGRERDSRTAAVANAAEVRDLLDGIHGDPILQQAVFQERADETAAVVERLLAGVSTLEKRRQLGGRQFADVRVGEMRRERTQFAAEGRELTVRQAAELFLGAAQRDIGSSSVLSDFSFSGSR